MQRRIPLPVAALLVSASLLGGCQKEPSGGAVRAYRVTDRSQLLGGGPRALGDVGDYMLENDRIRVVIQNAGFSRGFGVYGGGIIDADLRRPDEQGRNLSNASGGNDIFAEMFPSFFFQAVKCDKVEVLSDGSKAFDEDYGGRRVHYDAGTAVVRASGGGGEFLTMLKLFDSIVLSYLIPSSRHTDDGSNELIQLGVMLLFKFEQFAAEINSIENGNALYQVDYALRPGARHVEIHARMVNVTDHPLTIPSSILKNPRFQQELGGVDLSALRVPIGNVMLYGMSNNVWLAGVGFDLRHPIEAAFRRGLPLPTFNGVVTEFIASASHRITDRVSYGLIAEPSDENFVHRHADIYRDGGKYKDHFTPIDRSSLLVPFTAISFIGVFADSIRGTVAPGEYVEMVTDFIVGGGDVASVVDEVNVIRKTQTGRYEGQLLDGQTGEPSADGQIVIYQELASVTTDDFTGEDDYLDRGLRLCATAGPKTLCRPYSQDYPDDAGNLGGTLAPGRYVYRLQSRGRSLGSWVPFEIKAGERTRIAPRLPAPAWIEAFAVDESGRPIPAKVSVIGQYDEATSAARRRSGQVFDLQAGESYRFTDLLDDTVPGQRAYIETTGHTDANGRALLQVRPGEYKVYFSRGFEYDLVRVPSSSAKIRAEEAKIAVARGKLTRVVDTAGWLAMDSHMHSEHSIDSNMSVRDRLLSVAGEGLEIAISTDHNFLSDWRPRVEAMQLTPWMTTFVGIEFTTLESGHFNSFPLAYKIGPVTHGAFEWFGKPPADLFAGLRGLSQLPNGDNIIVCNHPRDAIQGYFNQYRRSSLTGGFLSPGTSVRLAGANGPAFYDERGRTTFSLDCDAIEIVNGKLGHEIHHVRVPDDWPAACYEPRPKDFDPKKDLDPCNLDGKVLRPGSVSDALVPGTILTDLAPTADPGPSGLDNVEAVFPGAVDDWFHLLNQGYRHTGLATSDSHGSVGQEPGMPRTYVRIGTEPAGVDAKALVDAIKRQRGATLSYGPFLTFTVAEGDGTSQGAGSGASIGGETAAPSGKVTVNYRLAAPRWVSVNRIHVWVNGKLVRRIEIDPDRDLSDRARAPGGPVVGQVTLSLDRDSWIVLEAAGDRSMFPVVTGTEEPFLLVSDAVGALAGPLGIASTTDIGAVVVGNEAPYAITNPIWIRVKNDTWQPPGVVPFAEVNVPEQDPHIGVLRSRN